MTLSAAEEFVEGAQSTRSLRGLADVSSFKDGLAIIIGSEAFDITMICSISVNFLIVVYETDARANGNPHGWCHPVELLFLAIYIIELSARFWLSNVSFFFSGLNVFDLFLVLADLLVLALEQVLDIEKQPSFAIFRVLRVMRLLAVIRRMGSLRELWLMLHGVASAMKAMFWAVTFIVTSCIILSVLAVDIIQPYNEELASAEVFHEECLRCPIAFSSVTRAAYTWFLLIFTGDLWGDMAVPIMEAQPGTVLIFLPAFVSINLGLLNLILTVIVDRAAEAREDDHHQMVADKEEQMKKAQAKLLKICKEMDDDDSGCLGLEEMEQGFRKNKEFAACLKLMDIGQGDLKTVFNILDNDMSGSITYSEFVDQIHKMKTQESHTILVFIKHYVQEIKATVQATFVAFKQSVEEEIQRDMLQLQQTQMLRQFPAEGMRFSVSGPVLTRDNSVNSSGLAAPQRVADSSANPPGGDAVRKAASPALPQPSLIEAMSRRLDEGLASLEQHAAQRAREDAVLARALAPSLALQLRSSGVSPDTATVDGDQDFFAVVVPLAVPASASPPAGVTRRSEGGQVMPVRLVQPASGGIVNDAARNHYLM